MDDDYLKGPIGDNRGSYAKAENSGHLIKDPSSANWDEIINNAKNEKKVESVYCFTPDVLNKTEIFYHKDDPTNFKVVGEKEKFTKYIDLDGYLSHYALDMYIIFVGWDEHVILNVDNGKIKRVNVR